MRAVGVFVPPGGSQLPGAPSRVVPQAPLTVQVTAQGVRRRLDGLASKLSDTPRQPTAPSRPASHRHVARSRPTSVSRSVDGSVSVVLVAEDEASVVGCHGDAAGESVPASADPSKGSSLVRQNSSADDRLTWTEEDEWSGVDPSAWDGEPAKRRYFGLVRRCPPPGTRPRPGSARRKHVRNCSEESVLPEPMGVVRRGSASSVNLSSYGMGDVFARTVSQTVANVPGIKSVNLSENRITDQSAVVLMERIGHTLHHLDLSFNHIGRAGANAMARQLETTTCLTSLDLEHNDMGDAAAAEIFEALLANNSLVRLNVARNGIAERGAAGLGALLEYHAALTEMNVSWNSVHGPAALSFAQGLARSQLLTRLDISWNALGSKLDDQTLLLFGQAKALTHLDASHNKLTAEDCTALSRAFVENGTPLLGVHLEGNRCTLGPDGRIVSLEDSCAAASASTDAHDRGVGFLGGPHYPHRPHFINRSSCWICGGWSLAAFTWTPGVSDVTSCTKVSVLVSAANWEALPMTQSADGVFRLTRMVPPGAVEFLFLVDSLFTCAVDQPWTHSYVPALRVVESQAADARISSGVHDPGGTGLPEGGDPADEEGCILLPEGLRAVNLLHRMPRAQEAIEMDPGRAARDHKRCTTPSVFAPVVPPPPGRSVGPSWNLDSSFAFATHRRVSRGHTEAFLSTVLSNDLRSHRTFAILDNPSSSSTLQPNAVAKGVELRNLLVSHYDTVLNVFAFYATVSGKTPFCVGLASFGRFCSDARIFDRFGVAETTTDTIFTELVEVQRGQQQPDNVSVHAAPGLLRAEFIRALLHIASAACKETAETEGVGGEEETAWLLLPTMSSLLGSTRTLLEEHVLPYAHHLDSTKFRRQRLHHERVDAVFHRHALSLSTVHNRLSRASPQGLVHLGQFFALMGHMELDDISHTVLWRAFLNSEYRVVETRPVHGLDFHMFLEALARVAHHCGQLESSMGDAARRDWEEHLELFLESVASTTGRREE